jgi:flagellar hook-length control protein FliK
MIQPAQIQMPAARPASPDSAAAVGEEDVFAQLLGAVGSDLPPAELRAAILEQVEQGMPLDQVLADLVRRLEQDAELVVPAAMMPSLNAAVEELAAGVEQPAERFVEFRGLLRGQVSAGPKGAAEAARPVVEHLPEGDLLAPEPGQGKDKPLPLQRLVGLPEPLTTLSTNTSAPQLPAFRPMEFAQQLGALLPATPEADGGELLQLPPRVGESGWGQALAQRVMWLIGRDQQTAQLRLNPAELGPLEVKVTVQQDQASVSLLASNGAVRDALEHALPRLRDMLGQQDIQLVQVNVAQRDASNGQQAATGQHQGQAAGGQGTAEQGSGEPDQPSTPQVRAESRGLVDAYA